MASSPFTPPLAASFGNATSTDARMPVPDVNNSQLVTSDDIAKLMVNGQSWLDTGSVDVFLFGIGTKIRWAGSYVAPLFRPRECQPI